MLSLMRKHAKSWFINVIIAAIALVFVFWGVGSYNEKGPTSAAVVNGEIISMAEYQNSYENLLENARQQYKEFLNEDLLKMLNLKRRAIENLIEQRLIEQQARVMGVEALNEEIQQKIRDTSIFQVDGIFDKKRYQNVLGRYRLTDIQYEMMLRQEEVNRKMFELVSGTAKVSEGEAREFFHIMNDRVDLDFVLFTPETYQKGIQPTDGEIKEYYEKNKERYRAPEKVKVAYLAFRPLDFEDGIEVGEDEIAEYFEFNLDKYRKPAQVKARHILFNLAPNATPEQEALVKAKAEAILEEAKKPDADFTELAKKYSEGPSAQNGGDLGWFTRDRMVEDFSNAAFDMKKGETRGLVKTPYGYHIIKVEDRREASGGVLDDVKEEIKAKLVTEKAVERAAEAAERTADEMALTQDFDATVKKMNLKPKTTDFFSMDQPLPEVGSDTKFNQLALAMQKGELSPLFELKDGHYLVKCLERQESSIPELSQVMEAVKADLIDKMAMEKAQEEAGKFLEQAKKQGDWKDMVRIAEVKKETAPDEKERKAEDVKPEGDAAPSDTSPTDTASTEPEKTPASDTRTEEPSTSETQTADTPPAVAPPVETSAAEADTVTDKDSDKPLLETTGAFRRDGNIPKIGSNSELGDDAFFLEKPGDFGKKPYKGVRGYYVVRLKERLPATEEEFKEQEKQLLQSLTRTKSQKYFRQWLESLKADATIEITDGVI